MGMLSANRWLYIILTIMAVPTIGFFGILYISIAHIPVNKENFLLEKYSNVDDNFNTIISDSMEFKKKYNFAFGFEKKGESIEIIQTQTGVKYMFPHGFTIGENTFNFKLTRKDGSVVNDAKATILLTRFETNDFDQKLTIASVSDGVYSVKPFNIEKSGRWKAIVRVEADKYKDVYEYRVFAK